MELKSASHSNLMSNGTVTSLSHDASETSSVATNMLATVSLEEFWTPGQPREVFVYFYVKRISRVDAALQDFDVSFYLYLLWKPSVDELRGIEEDPDNFKPEWTPLLVLLNLNETITEKSNNRGRKSDVHLVKHGFQNAWGDKCSMENAGIKTLLGMAKEYFVTCAQSFDLRSFPFDCQSITMLYESDLNTDAMRLFPCWIGFGGEPATSVFQEDKGELVDWTTHPPQFEIFKAGNYDTMALTFKLQRRWISYFWRVMFTAIVISTLTLTSYAIPVKETSNRLTLAITLLLTMVAFQFITSGYIPRLAYLTILDKFITTCFLFISTIITQSALFGYLSLSDQQDTIFAQALIAIMGTGLLVFLVLVTFYVMPAERRKLAQSHTSTVGITDVADFSVPTTEVVECQHFV